jgi:acyl-CoA synthetase (AMP-forming)/AMP-acid ligase II
MAPHNLVAMLRATAEQVGDDRGIRYYPNPGSSAFVGFRELDRRSRAIAACLTARGMRPGDVVVIAIADGRDFIAATYGAMYAGLVVAPAAMAGFGDTGVVAERIATIAADSGAKLLLTEDAFASTCAAGGDGVGIPSVTVAALVQSGDAEAWVDPQCEPDALAALIYTSGSTGSPKGVMLTHAGLLAFLQIALIAMQADARSVIVGWMPLHHSLGLIMHVLLPAYLGADVVLTATQQFQRRPVFWLQLISRHHATISIGSNFAFELCTQFATDEQIAELDLSSLTVLMTAGETVRVSTVREFVHRFAPAGMRESMVTPAMGLTEVTYVAVKPIHTAPVILNADAAALEAGMLTEAGRRRATQLVSCGHPAPLCSVAIVDQRTGQRLEDGRIGEIWMTSPAVSPGYWQKPEATSATFGGRLTGDDRRWVRTGDLGGMVNDNLFLTGRVKDLIIVRGRNIYPADLEAAAAGVHPAVGIAAAFEIAGATADVGIAFEVDPEGVAEHDLAAVAATVRTALVREFSLPSLAVAVLPAGGMPLTAGGKVRRILTGRMLESGELTALHVEGFPARTQRQPGVAYPQFSTDVLTGSESDAGRDSGTDSGTDSGRDTRPDGGIAV